MSIDPLDTSERARQGSFAEEEHHDFGATGEIPLEISKTRSRKDSRVIRPLNKLLGRTEEELSETDNTLTEGPSESDDKEQDGYPPTERRDSEHPLEKMHTTKSEKKKRNKDAFHKVAFMFARVYLIIICGFVGILSIYWGSMYNKTHYLKNLNYLIVVDDIQLDQLPPFIGLTVISVFNSSSAAKAGTFDIKTGEELLQTSHGYNNTIYQEVNQLVHHQKYWGALYVPQNATLDYYTALKTHNPNFNTSFIDFIYETGREPQTISSFVLATIVSLEKSFLQVAGQTVTQSLLKQLNDTERVELSQRAPNLLTQFWFNYVDNRPMIIPTIFGPFQLGMIFLVVLSFHQFNFASSTHAIMRQKLHLKQYLVYHYLTSHISYILMGLVYSLMTLAFQIPVTRTFGYSGFLVEWAFLYLTMAALGGVSENVALVVFAVNRAFIGFWVCFWMVSNVVPIFSAIPMMNRFYRWGYAMPLYNGHELMKVVFFNTYKGYMGRNIGILIAWIALSSIVLPFTLKWTKNYAIRVQERAQKALKEGNEKN